LKNVAFEQSRDQENNNQQRKRYCFMKPYVSLRFTLRAYVHHDVMQAFAVNGAGKGKRQSSI